MSSNSFFSAGSPYLTHPLLTDQRTATEVDTIVELSASTSGPVLDVGCGFGRHSIEFAKRARQVTGIDPSPTMIEAAGVRALDAGVSVDFQQVGANDFHATEPFALAICLFSTLGQRESTKKASPSSEPEHRMLESIADALASTAPLVLEVPDKDRTLDTLVTQEQLGPTTVERRFDEETSRIHETFRTPDTTFALSYRISTSDELQELLHASGFEVRHAQRRGLVEPPSTFNTFVAHKLS